jgi:hypothetical protein
MAVFDRLYLVSGHSSASGDAGAFEVQPAHGFADDVVEVVFKRELHDFVSNHESGSRAKAELFSRMKTAWLRRMTQSAVAGSPGFASLPPLLP